MRSILAALAVLASAQLADAQGIYMLNGRATPSVIIGADGAVFPVVPGLQLAGPSPLILAPPLPWRARARQEAPLPPLPPEYLDQRVPHP